ncbi:kinase-like domain-containing protein [Syncephalastrum racemosum]|uniref:Kinase-like domain-containing protein n=1 Tax=Syncephalastrum racemosum TaxID=13706 RepID=A0A1X2HL36_SYNRA|nr:kinase-like domain-containing protein [Syncephalastrum racemosum]
MDITRHPGGGSVDDCSSFKRPPKSPLRPMSKPNQRSSSMRRAHRRRKSAEDVRSNRRPSAPAFSSHSKAGLNMNSDIVPMSRTSSASSCSSFLSSTSSSNSLPETPVTPPSRHLHEGEQAKTRSKSMDHRRQSLYLQHQQRHADYQEETTTTSSLGRKLDRHLLKSMEAIKQDEKDREKLMLKSKDGLTRVQYQLGNCIGKGQFGSVYRALDLGTGETVAVKRIRLEDAELDQEIMKEVSLLKTLSHSNVIQYLGFIRSRHHINIVLEYAENGSLMSTLKAFGSFPEKLVASFCIKILNGLEYLHANEVVHCDLKAANILTTKTGDVKLSDFGVSLNLKIKGADAGSVSGTPNWMAPEVIELKGASTKADIWSLGCTLVELITGKPPYADMIAMSAMFRIVEDDYPPIPGGISPELHSFLLCCFQKNPNDRPTASQLKEHNWIRNNQRRMKKNDTASNGLSSYLDQQKRNATKDGHGSTASSRASRRRSSHRISNATYDSACHPLDAASVTSNHTASHQSHHHHHHHNRPSTPSRRSSERPRSGIYETHTPIAIPQDYITHRFIQTSFGKAVECKVCGDLIKSQTIFCEACALICHEECKKLAFSCPPKVNDQQPSYDWVFSAKIYNRSRDDRSGSQDSARSMPEVTLNRQDMFSSLENHPQAESIRKYSRALGLTPQEQRALSQNQALLSHTLALQHMEPEAVKTLIKKSNKDRKKGNGSDEDCVIS